MSSPFGGENIYLPVVLTDQADPVQGTAEFAAAEVRDTATRYIGAMPWLPQLPDEWAVEIYNKVVEAEKWFAAPNLRSDEYSLGTAVIPDEIGLTDDASEQTGYLFTAEHATQTVRAATGKLGYPDTGTAGLAAVLGENYGTGLIMRGLQQGNAATDPDHPLKREITRLLPSAHGYLSIHGKKAGSFVRPTDRTEIHATLGLGAEPTDANRDLAYQIIAMARDYFGLYVTIGNQQKHYMQEPGTTSLKRNDNGTAYRGQLGALGPNSTVNFVGRQLTEAGHDLPNLQVELTHLLRVTPWDTNKKDRKSRIIGVALGYKLLEHIVVMSDATFAAVNQERSV